MRNLESPFMQSIHIPLRKNISPRWLAESDKKNLCEIHDTDIQSGERKKRTKILSKNGSFNREAGMFSKNRQMLHKLIADICRSSAFGIIFNYTANIAKIVYNFKLRKSYSSDFDLQNKKKNRSIMLI